MKFLRKSQTGSEYPEAGVKVWEYDENDDRKQKPLESFAQLKLLTKLTHDISFRFGHFY